MPNKTPIEWTDFTSNPIRFRDKRTGKLIHFCVHKSAGCLNCYSESYNHRFGGGFDADGNKVPALGYKAQNAQFVEAVLDGKELQEIIKLNNRLAKAGETAKMFPFDMTDLFLHLIPDEMIDKFFAVAALCPQITFQVLTKRIERMQAWLTTKASPLDDSRADIVMERAAYLGKIVWDARGANPYKYPNGTKANVANRRPRPEWPLPNVWLGTSVENQQTADERIPQLIRTPAAVRWLSIEPLLSGIILQGDGEYNNKNALHSRALLRGVVGQKWIDWVVVGGESGTGARQCDIQNIRSIVKQCKAANVAVFVKQLGSNPFDGGVDCGWPNHQFGAQGVNLKDRKGGDINEFPEDLRIREFPGRE